MSNAKYNAMKTIYFIALAFFTANTIVAQATRPAPPLSKPVTGTENITGSSSAKVTSIAEVPTKAETSAASATRPAGGQVNTDYGKNNDGSSTGTTVTGNGATNANAPVDGYIPPGTVIATPRSR